MFPPVDPACAASNHVSGQMYDFYGGALATEIKN